MPLRWWEALRIWWVVGWNRATGGEALAADDPELTPWVFRQQVAGYIRRRALCSDSLRVAVELEDIAHTIERGDNLCNH